MECPSCAGVSLAEESAGGITLDRCPNCRGIWLDSLELELLLKGKPEALLKSDEMFLAVGRSATATLHCPVCRGAQLIKLNSRLRPGTVIDSCQVCFGTWLDAGELTRLASPELANAIAAIFVG